MTTNKARTSSTYGKRVPVPDMLFDADLLTTWNDAMHSLRARSYINNDGTVTVYQEPRSED